MTDHGIGSRIPEDELDGYLIDDSMTGTRYAILNIPWIRYLKMRKIVSFALQASLLSCISEAGFSQQTESRNTSSSVPVFVEMIDGSVTPDAIPKAHIYEILSSAMVDNGPSRCSDAPQSEIRTVAPCRSLITGLDPASLERLGEAVVAYNRSEDEKWQEQFCLDSDARGLRSSTVEEFSSVLESSERSVQQNKVAFFEEQVSRLFDAEQAERILSFADNEITKNTQYTKINYPLMMSVTRITPSSYLDSLCN